MSQPRIEIDAARLMADLRRLADFGRHGTGVSRIAFSEPDLAARAWLRDRMEEAGLAATIDDVGNVLGRSPRPGPAVLIGSHVDSVPDGGWLDGAMGAIYGLEIARAAVAAGRFAVDVVAFQDEESTYLSTLGSRTVLGEVAADEIAAAHRLDGHPLTEALAASGLAANPPLRLERERYRCFLEAHIEQGPRLEAAGIPIGVVTAIVGIRRFRIELTGEAGHAGTVPMAMRKDAGAAAIALGHALAAAFAAAAGPDTVWNVGRLEFAPGAANVIPAKAVITLEIRDTADAELDRLEADLRALASSIAAERGIGLDLVRTLAIAPAAMDPALGAAIEAAAGDLGAPSIRLPSGAGHDAGVLARRMPAAMLFVPSIGGRSHTTAEDTAEADIVLGCRVLAGAVARILG